MRKATLNGKYAAYPEYKDSGIEWLGNIPRHWIISSLRWRIKIASGEGISTTLVEKHSDYINTYPVIGGNGVMGYAKSHNTSNAIIIGRVGALCGNIHLINFDAWVSDNALKISSWESLYDKYFVNLLKTAKLNDLASKTAQPLLTGEQIKNLIVAIPPFNDQTQIAAFLDHETAKIDTLIEKQQQLIELLKEKRQAVISHVVTKGLNPDALMKDSGVEWLGEVPEHWAVCKIKQLAIQISKGTTPSTIGGEFVSSGVRFLKGENIGKGLYVNSAPEFFITEAVDEQISRSRLQENDVLVIIAGATTGKTSILQKELLPANTNQAVSFIRPKKEIQSKWIHFWLSTEFAQRIIWMGAVQAAQPNLSMEDLGNIPITIPLDNEIEDILTEINVQTSRFEYLINKAQQAIQLMQERRTALISAAVTGKIDVRNWVSPTTSNDTNETVQKVNV